MITGFKARLFQVSHIDIENVVKVELSVENYVGGGKPGSIARFPCRSLKG
jgi:hypothetical protein